MNQKINKAFTLVELIVVITILAILGTIAFISLQGYSKQARDSRRVSDVSNIKTSLEMYSLSTGKYPIPDKGYEVTYNIDLLWTQGVVGDNVTQNLSQNLSKKPTDPLHDIEYIYSVTHSGKEYELLSFYEGDVSNKLGNDVFAANILKPRISGNYNGIFVKTVNNIIPTPSIINSEVDGGDIVLGEDTIKSQVLSAGDNFPNVNIPGAETITGKLNIGFIATGVIDNSSSDAEKISIINSIQEAYSGSELANDSMYQNILGKSTDTEKLDVFSYLFDGLKTTSSQSSPIVGNDDYTKLLIQSDNEALSFIGDGYGIFDGNGDYITLANNSFDSFGANGTISVWTNSKIAGGKFFTYGNAEDYTYYLSCGITSEKQFTASVRTSSTSAQWSCASTDTIELNTWNHLAWTQENGIATKFYINGSEVTYSCSSETTSRENAYFDDIASAAELGTIGAFRRYDLDHFVDGYIDDMSFFNRTLSSGEISDIYQRGMQGLPNNITSGLFAYYPMDSDFSDSSTNNINGSIVGDTHLSKDGKTFMDVSLGASEYHDIVVYGDIINSSTEKKFGDTSIYFDGDGDYLSVTNSDDFTFLDQDFTIDFWANTNSAGQASNSVLLGKFDDARYPAPFVLYMKSGTYDVVLSSANPTQRDLINGAAVATLSPNTWSHIAITRKDDNVYTYQDGVLKSKTNIGTVSLLNQTTPLLIGGGNWVGTYFDGYMDEFRVSKGIARWDGTDYNVGDQVFEVSTQAYGN